MIDTVLAYLISLGIVSFGIIWIVSSTNSATSTAWIAIGAVTIAVGLISALFELRNGTR